LQIQSQVNFNPFKEGYYSNYFDGTGDYLSVPAVTATQNQWWTGDFTIDAWVYPTNLSTWLSNEGPCLIGNMEAGTVTNYWSFGPNTNGTVRFKYWNGVIGTNVDSTETISLNRWSHIAFVKDSNGFRIYVNGVGTANTAISGTPQSVSGLIIGQYNSTSILGYVSNIRILKGTALYTTNFTPATGPLTYVANTTLLTCQSNKLIDNSNNNFTITKNGDTTVSPFSPFNGTATTVTVPDANNYSMYFDGTGDYLSIPSNAAFGFGTGDFTVEYWVYSTSWASGPTVVELRPNSGVLEFSDNYSTGGAPGVYYNSTQQLTSSISIPINTWAHVAYTRSGTTMKVWVNGVEGATGTKSDNLQSTGTPKIGNNWPNANPFQGYISNLRIVKGTAVYTASFTPPTSPLTAITNTRLLTCQANTVIDNSTNAFTITTNGDVRPARNGPFANTTTVTLVGNEGSAYFDGTGDYLTLPANASLGMGSGNFTIEFWMYQTALSSYKQILDVLDGNSAGRLILWVDSGGTLYNLGAGGISRHSTAGGAIAINTWTHVALVRSSGTTKFYINGAQSGTNYTDSTTYTCTTGTVYIGINSDGSTYPYVGYLSNFRMVKGTALYTTPFVPTWAPLTPVANTVLLIAQTNVSSNTKVFVDESNFNNIITPTGNTALGSFTPFGSTWSGYFDGTGDYLSLPVQVYNLVQIVLQLKCGYILQEATQLNY
jgi:hypothetical protein